MFANHLAAAIEAARPSQLDHHARDLWRAHGAGLISDVDAQAFAEAIEARRDRKHAVMHAPMLRSIFPVRRPQHARKHPERIARRRRLAASGPLPPQLAAEFTTGETAVLRIVGDDVRQGGKCDRSLAEIAARAGVCRSLAQSTLRRAERLGLISIVERRRAGQKNLPNLVSIISAEWRTWIMRGPKGIGSRKIAPTDTDIKSSGFEAPATPVLIPLQAAMHRSMHAGMPLSVQGVEKDSRSLFQGHRERRNPYKT